MKKNKLAIFDFDGTISFKDSIKEFLKFSFGNFSFIYGYYLRFIHLLFLCFFGFFDYKKLKEKRINFFLENLHISDLQQKVDSFNSYFFPKMIKKDALKKLKWHKKEDHQIIILSASLKILLENWCSNNSYLLIANELVLEDSILNGKLEEPDCSFGEKVNRLKKEINIDSFEYIYGYGDSESDLDFLKLVDEAYFQYFKK